MSVKRSELELQAILRETRPQLFRLALAIVANRDVAEDVTQETLMRASRSFTKLSLVDDPISWLRRVLVRCATDSFSSRPKPCYSDEQTSEFVTNDLAVRLTLDRLTPSDRALLALVHFEELSYREISQTLDIPEGTVASRVFAARQAFRKEWQK